MRKFDNYTGIHRNLLEELSKGKEDNWDYMPHFISIREIKEKDALHALLDCLYIVKERYYSLAREHTLNEVETAKYNNVIIQPREYWQKRFEEADGAILDTTKRLGNLVLGFSGPKVKFRNATV